MVKLIRFLGLLSEAIFLQFVHVFGLVAFLLAAAIGYFRLPSWLVPILAVVLGVIADKYIDLADVSGLLDKASAASQRGGFMILVYFAICAVGYVVGAYGRHHFGRIKPAEPTKKS
jgi:tetrahydromethanopterin S-methyltransferase subunit C